ncbi:MAG: hypothetical protein QM747_20830 [Nocardioides sp.]
MAAATSPLRTTGAAVLVVLGCILAVVSVLAVWGRDQVLDTDSYLATVGPLASNRVVQDDVATRVTAVIDRRIDAAAEKRLPKGAHVPRPVNAAVHKLVADQAHSYVRSSAFQTLWVTANRAGHTQLVKALTGQGAVSVESGRLTLDLSPVVRAVRDRLVAAGVHVVALLPPITLVVDIGDASRLETARTVVHRLDQAAFVLPIVALTLLAGAVLLARRRRRALIWTGVAVAATMLVLLLGIRLGSGVATDRLSSSTGSYDLVHALYHDLTRTLVRSTAVVAALALVVVLAAFAAGFVRKSSPDR